MSPRTYTAREVNAWLQSLTTHADSPLAAKAASDFKQKPMLTYRSENLGPLEIMLHLFHL